jgi:hypothetical protein
VRCTNLGVVDLAAILTNGPYLALAHAAQRSEKMGGLNPRHSAENRAPNPGGKGGGGAGTPERPASMLGTGSRVFGLYDRVACSVCGQDTYLRRRSPHTSDSDAYEFKTFSCRTCNASTTRVVDSTGRPRPER